MDNERAVLAELTTLRQVLPDLSGSVLAGLDGMLIAQDAPGLEVESIAALSAASLGLTQRFAHTVGHGDLRETVIQSSGGFIATYAAGQRNLLTVLAAPRADVVRIQHEARRAARRIGELLDQAHHLPRPVPPTATGRSSVDLARRTPMATVGHTVPGQRRP